VLNRGGIFLTAIGVVGILIGFIGFLAKPESRVTLVANPGTPVVEIPASALALFDNASVTFAGSGIIDVVSGRPSDVAAWLEPYEYETLRGFDTWETLDLDFPAVDLTPSPSGSPSTSESPTQATPSATSPAPSATPSPTASPTAGAGEEEGVDPQYASLATAHTRDIWRSVDSAPGEATVVGAVIENGLSVVVIARDATAFDGVSVEFERNVGLGWIAVAFSLGAAFALVGVVMLTFDFLDLRPTGARIEEWIARIRNSETSDTTGLRKARRQKSDPPKKDVNKEGDA